MIWHNFRIIDSYFSDIHSCAAEFLTKYPFSVTHAHHFTMGHTNLIIALVFAAVFGSALIWLAFYYVSRYIHLRCWELDHWFHLLTPPRWHTPCPHCEGMGRDVKETSRSRSSRRMERSKSRGRQGRSRHGQRMIEADTEYDGIGQEQERMRRPMRALPMSSSMQSQGAGQKYDPWQAQMQGGQQMGMAYNQPAMYPQAYTHMFMPTFPQPYAQGGPQSMPYAMPQQQTAHRPMPTLSSISSVPVYKKTPRKARTERLEPQTKSRHLSREVPRVHRTDYIHIVSDPDDLPPIVGEAMEKAKKEAPTPSSSSGSSTSAESAEEEVPRTSIPQAPTRFTEPQPFQFPQNPDLTTQAWNGQVFYSQPWHGNTGGDVVQNEQTRYASLYPRPRERMSRHVDVDGRRYIPSNTPPRRSARVYSRSKKNMLTRIGDRRCEPVGRRLIPRPKHTNQLTRTRETSDLEERRKSKRQGEGFGANARADAPDQRCSDRGRTTVEGATTRASHQPPLYAPTPKMSPMPLPIVEEPVSDSGSAGSAGSAEGKKPTILGMPLNLTDDAPVTAAAPSPLFDICSLSTSPLSAVSSLHEGSAAD
jgi:hypothetical protein